MPPTNSLDLAATSITSGVGKLTGLLNFAPGPTAMAGFVAEGIFKAIKLGVAIRAAQRQANAGLDASIRAMDVLRSPIIVDLSVLKLQSFYSNEDNIDPFPGYRQFDAEIKEFRLNGVGASPAVKHILAAAMEIVPALQLDPDLTDHPELAAIFAIGLDPVKRSARELVLAYLELFPDGKMSYQEQYNRLGDFWKNQLSITLGEIDQTVLNAQNELNAAIRSLVGNAIFDPGGGLLAPSLDLAKKLKKTAIDEQIGKLAEQKTAAADPDKPRIQAQIDRLTAWKTRLA